MIFGSKKMIKESDVHFVNKTGMIPFTEAHYMNVIVKVEGFGEKSKKKAIKLLEKACEHLEEMQDKPESKEFEVPF